MIRKLGSQSQTYEKTYQDFSADFSRNSGRREESAEPMLERPIRTRNTATVILSTRLQVRTARAPSKAMFLSMLLFSHYITCESGTWSLFARQFCFTIILPLRFPFAFYMPCIFLFRSISPPNITSDVLACFFLYIDVLHSLRRQDPNYDPVYSLVFTCRFISIYRCTTYYEYVCMMSPYVVRIRGGSFFSGGVLSRASARTTDLYICR